MRHQYGLISALVFQTSFRGETVLLALRNVCFLRLLQLLLFHPVRINSRRPWNLDSWPWILDSRYWIPVFQSWIPDFLSCIPDSKVQDFWFYRQKISWTPKSRFSHKGLPVVLWSEVSFWPVNCFKITCTFLLLLEFLVRRNYHNLPQVSLLSLSTAAVRIWRVYWMELKKNKGAWQGEVNMCKKERKER